jgi:hypothetical protein
MCFLTILFLIIAGFQLYEEEYITPFNSADESFNMFPAHKVEISAEKYDNAKKSGFSSEDPEANYSATKDNKKYFHYDMQPTFDFSVLGLVLRAMVTCFFGFGFSPMIPSYRAMLAKDAGSGGGKCGAEKKTTEAKKKDSEKGQETGPNTRSSFTLGLYISLPIIVFLYIIAGVFGYFAVGRRTLLDTGKGGAPISFLFPDSPAYLKPTISLTIIINLLISYPLIISAPLRALERLLVLIANKAAARGMIGGNKEGSTSKSRGLQGDKGAQIMRKMSAGAGKGGNGNSGPDGNSDSNSNNTYDPTSPPVILCVIARTVGVLITLGIVACFSFNVKALGYMVDLLGSLFSTTLCAVFPFISYQVAKASENKRVLEEKEVERIMREDVSGKTGSKGGGGNVSGGNGSYSMRSYESVKAEVAKKNLSGYVFDFEFFLQLFCGVITTLVAIFGVCDTIARMASGE